MSGTNFGLPHHPYFYLDSVIFAVEGILFKVPRCGFEGRTGTPFEMAANISGQVYGTEREGLVDSKPIHLHQIKSVEFESLLKAMYPQLLHNITPLVSERPLTRAEWIHVLNLSTMWDFGDIRQMAIEKLSVGFDPNPVEKILLAKSYGVPSWLLEGYTQLVGQQAPLSTRTLDSLDWKTKVSLLSIRDRYPPAVYGDAQYTDHEGSSPTMVICNKCRSKNHVGSHDMLAILKKMFAAELADMS